MVSGSIARPGGPLDAIYQVAVGIPIVPFRGPSGEHGLGVEVAPALLALLEHSGLHGEAARLPAALAHFGGDAAWLLCPVVHDLDLARLVPVRGGCRDWQATPRRVLSLLLGGRFVPTCIANLLAQIQKELLRLLTGRIKPTRELRSGVVGGVPLVAVVDHFRAKHEMYRVASVVISRTQVKLKLDLLLGATVLFERVVGAQQLQLLRRRVHEPRAGVLHPEPDAETEAAQNADDAPHLRLEDTHEQSLRALAERLLQ
mmetsp:Transcript_32189/g.72609  ORF Transcript_32189/g.72609 Transcript_32189/m.72609 type:complete len:258 (-) Transcript_32189:1226-1999(-)